MLERLFTEPLVLGTAQAVAATLLALLVLLLARSQGVHLERETVVALARGLVQVVAIGSILLLLLNGPLWVSVPVLLAMIGIGASIAASRTKEIPGAFWTAMVGIGLGAGAVIAGMTLLGAIDPRPSSLIPVGSMVVASAMNASTLALDRFRSEVEAHTGQIEAALSLGAEANETVTPYVQAAAQASLIPAINSLSSLGIVWIPGLMAGMILAGSDPVYAAVYQFVVIAMLFAASGLTSIVCTRLVRGRAFSPAQQLMLRPGPSEGD
jgi:putative ABC transport system permease protein